MLSLGLIVCVLAQEYVATSRLADEGDMIYVHAACGSGTGAISVEICPERGCEYARREVVRTEQSFVKRTMPGPLLVHARSQECADPILETFAMAFLEPEKNMTIESIAYYVLPCGGSGVIESDKPVDIYDTSLYKSGCAKHYGTKEHAYGPTDQTDILVIIPRETTVVKNKFSISPLDRGRTLYSHCRALYASTSDNNTVNVGENMLSSAQTAREAQVEISRKSILILEGDLTSSVRLFYSIHREGTQVAAGFLTRYWQREYEILELGTYGIEVEDGITYEIFDYTEDLPCQFDASAPVLVLGLWNMNNAFYLKFPTNATACLGLSFPDVSGIATCEKVPERDGLFYLDPETLRRINGRHFITLYFDEPQEEAIEAVVEKVMTNGVPISISEPMRMFVPFEGESVGISYDGTGDWDVCYYDVPSADCLKDEIEMNGNRAIVHSHNILITASEPGLITTNKVHNLMIAEDVFSDMAEEEFNGGYGTTVNFKTDDASYHGTFIAYEVSDYLRQSDNNTLAYPVDYNGDLRYGIIYSDVHPEDFAYLKPNIASHMITHMRLKYTRDDSETLRYSTRGISPFSTVISSTSLINIVLDPGRTARLCPCDSAIKVYASISTPLTLDDIESFEATHILPKNVKVLEPNQTACPQGLEGFCNSLNEIIIETDMPISEIVGVYVKENGTFSVDVPGDYERPSSLSITIANNTVTVEPFTSPVYEVYYAAFYLTEEESQLYSITAACGLIHGHSFNLESEFSSSGLVPSRYLVKGDNPVHISPSESIAAGKYVVNVVAVFCKGDQEYNYEVYEPTIMDVTGAGGLPPGAIAGIVCACVVVVAGIIAGVVYFCMKRRRVQSDRQRLLVAVEKTRKTV